MSEPKQHSYANDKIRVSFDGRICCHVGFCFQQLNAVFEGDRDPPIDLDGAPLEAIIAQVEKCPSGALSYERLDGARGEQPDAEASLAIPQGGPLSLRGDLQLGDTTATRLTLCRCGLSRNKPYCDGAHRRAEWDDGLTIEAEAITDPATGGPLKLTPFPDGPIGFQGEVRIVKFADGQFAELGCRDRGALCRCGASKTKPFCDGSHTAIGFKSED